MEILAKFIVITITLLALYTLVPTFLARVCGLGALCSISGKGNVAITFDDGPDPLYTPQVLEQLKKHEVKACFFVLGEMVVHHPELAKKIVEEGHDIGCHGLQHKIAWTLSPGASLRQIKDSYKIIQEKAGVVPIAFRPPWGLVNALFYLYNWLGNKIVLWSYMSWDWSKGATAEEITRRSLAGIKDGTILVLHDSDRVTGAAPGSPLRMLEALPEIVKGIRDRGFNIVPLNKIINNNTRAPKNFIRSVWSCWDGLIRLLFNIKDIEFNGGPTMFRAAPRKYPGPAIILGCGSKIKKGDRVCEIHLNNDYIKNHLCSGESDINKISLKLVMELKQSLPALAHHLITNPKYENARAAYAITMLHRGSKAMGFASIDIPQPLLRRLIALYQGLILVLYHPQGKRRLAHREKLVPKVIAISKEDLLTRYGHYFK